jgi:hypothetical protein
MISSWMMCNCSTRSLCHSFIRCYVFLKVIAVRSLVSIVVLGYVVPLMFLVDAIVGVVTA